jgi:hypothetical protein
MEGEDDPNVLEYNEIVRKIFETTSIFYKDI